MSLSLALNNALTGLKVSQKSLSVLSHNIANANTPGYSRQIVDQSAIYVDNVGEGAQVDGISRKIDIYLQRAIQAQTSNVGQATVTDDYMSRMQILFGEPGNANSIDEYITDFFNSIQSLAETPERTSFRANAVNSGVTLARQIYDLAYSTEDLRYQADQDIGNSIKYVNNQLQALYDLNLAIAHADSMGTPSAGLLDQRDTAVKNIAENLNVKAYYKENGEVNLYTGNGVSLLDDSLYQIEYSPASSINSFIGDADMNAIKVVRYNEDGTPTNEKTQIVSGGHEGSVTTVLQSGKIKGYLDLRDNQLPQLLSQLDLLAANIRDAFNAIHNNGSGFPGATELTGTRLVSADYRSDWSGHVQIAVLDEDGKPVAPLYSDEVNGVKPLDLDLTFLDSGFGKGQPTVQTIIDEINNYYGPPQNKAEVGNLNNIQIVSDSSMIPGIPPQFKFDFDLDNISGTDADFFVTGITVLDDTATNITATTSTLPAIALDPLNTYTTTFNSGKVTVQSQAAHGLQNGDVVYLGPPAGPIDGLTPSELSGYFTVSNVTGNTFDITTTGIALTGTTVADATATAAPKYDTMEAGQKGRTRDNGIVTADLSGNALSTYYDISVNVGVDDGTGNVKTSTITYRVYNNQTNFLNDRLSATAVTGNGKLQLPATVQGLAHAMLVDANGNELPKINGSYMSGEGYLKIMTYDGTKTISISELDSQHLGIASAANPAVPATNRAFSYYFELNNFFESNKPVPTGDTVAGSAINMKVEDRFMDDPNLITTGVLTRSNQTPDPDDAPQWTYERYIGDNSTIQKLAGLAGKGISFVPAGGLPATTQTFNGYAGEILGLNAANASKATSTLNDYNTLLDGFSERSDAISGVNLDEELANTIIYQNAYTASARVITVTKDLFGTLLDMV